MNDKRYRRASPRENVTCIVHILQGSTVVTNVAAGSPPAVAPDIDVQVSSRSTQFIYFQLQYLFKASQFHRDL